MPTTTGTSQHDRKTASASSSKPIPAWLPISLLAVTTVALAVPIVLLRRQRSNALLNTFPPRRAGDPSSLASRFTPIPNIPPSNVTATQWPPPRRRSGGTTSFQGSRLTLPSSSASSVLTAVESDEFNDRPMSNDEFNAPLYTAKAFGIATLIVAVCASAAVWSVKTSLDVKDTREFGDRTRDAVIKQLPYLSHRIYRRPNSDSEASSSAPNSDVDTEWKWTEADERLNKALDEGGPSAWAEALVAELEHEERRLKNDQNA
ncbi:hypothetical protein PILCRDRAFT_337125 [Piloderma croceum F 1598]|uniref:Altered inheritance of mitochondria protein 11 n=1 Tax=Piloderma croceum (strain F 1598) TaxID=765440 RepID=A0A0C3G092_PILCF|nr:hypothetical protein PILCRDRAFT_337125 [Piloderma croceum F 1598]